MNRRKALQLAGALSLSALAGCSGSLPSTSSADTTAQGSSTPIADANPWNGTIIILRGAEAKDIRGVYDDVSRILSATAPMAFIPNEDSNAVRETAEQAGFEVLSVSSISWQGGPVCDVRTWTRFSGDPSQDDVKSAFPDAIELSRTASVSSSEYWSVFTSVSDPDTITTRLEELGVGDTASVMGIRGCETSDGS